MHANPYVFYNGDCAQALEFYKKTLDAVVGMVMPYSAMPAPTDSCNVPFDMAAMADKIMHAEITIGQTVVMMSDCPPVYSKPRGGFSLALAADSADQAEQVFAGLSEGGTVTMPLGPTFFAEKYGQLTDKFGIEWMVIFGDKAP